MQLDANTGKKNKTGDVFTKCKELQLTAETNEDQIKLAAIVRAFHCGETITLSFHRNTNQELPR